MLFGISHYRVIAKQNKFIKVQIKDQMMSLTKRTRVYLSFLVCILFQNVTPKLLVCNYKNKFKKKSSLSQYCEFHYTYLFKLFLWDVNPCAQTEVKKGPTDTNISKVKNY